MAFWGVEVRPGNAYEHLYDPSRGRLRVSQATLGVGKATGKSVLQCNVGNKSPILLCCLLPNVSESCHLELEFEEDTEVTFSVVGPRSIHLTGYFLGGIRSQKEDGYGSDEERGFDIAETESDVSGSYYTSDDQYESDFIDDDGDFDGSPSGHTRSSVVIEEILDDETPVVKQTNRGRLKKKSDAMEQDGGHEISQRQLAVKRTAAVFMESEDEDGFPVSFLGKGKGDAQNTKAHGNAENDKPSEDGKSKIHAAKNVSDLTSNQSKKNDPSVPSDAHTGHVKNSGKKKKAKDGKSIEACPEVEVDGLELSDDKVKIIDFTAEGEDTADKPQAKKKKERAIKQKTPEEVVDMSMERSDGQPKDTSHEDDIKVDENKGDSLSGIIEKNTFAASKEADNSSPAGDTSEASGKKKRKRKKNKDAVSQNGFKEDGPVEGEKPDSLASPKRDTDKTGDQSASEGKKAKKKSKTQPDALEGREALDLADGNERSGSPGRTFPNGLVVEKLSMGKPDGKKATPGKTVSVSYIGKLENGKIFDSNINQKPFKFRLGVGQVIAGWDYGINGMRVGDKRRFKIPPSMGYGSKNSKAIPANSWLFFDVELMDVK